MQSPWSEDGRREIGAIAERHGFSEDAGVAMGVALAAGGGAMAQFGHPEFGGMGQWSQGGMLMIGDMFNDGLKHRVRGLADELASAMRDGRVAAPKSSASWGGGRWWPEELGQPSSSGSQNGQRYAVFPGKRRLAIERDGRVTVHDTGDHRIGGVSQQQGSGSNLSFSGNLGSVNLWDLPEIGGSPERREEPPRAFEPSAFEPSTQPAPSLVEPATQPHAAPAGATPTASASGDPIELIRRLAELRDAGVLSESEFSAKKTELLSRL
jgi:hypothetical protein